MERRAVSLIFCIGRIDKQAEAEVVPSSGYVYFKLESDFVCLRFVKFSLY